MPEHVDVKPLKDVLRPEEVNESTFEEIQGAVFSSAKGLSELRRLLGDWDAEVGDGFKNKTEAYLVRGYCCYLNGELESAEELLRQAHNDPWGYYWLIRVTLDMDYGQRALSLAEKARERYPDCNGIRWLMVEVLLAAGREDEAEKAMSEMNKKERGTVLFSLLQGQLAERRGEYADAIDLYRKTVDLDPRNARALFRLGYLSGLYGDDEEAIACLEACTELSPVHVNALMNLGILYEDVDRYDDALRCYRTVLEYYPNHARAKLYLRDAEASTSMFYDREREKRLSRQNRILRIPVTDFELSVRSRNCLARMNVETLGDLTMKTEAELLACPNVGETSVKEIKALLEQQGLRLGEGLKERESEQEGEIEELEKGVDPEVLGRPIESLNLSIRSRRCMERLKIRTIRDLIRKSEVDLMSAKNFGMTSLKEVKEKLAEIGLKLRS